MSRLLHLRRVSATKSMVIAAGVTALDSVLVPPVPRQALSNAAVAQAVVRVANSDTVLEDSFMFAPV